MVSAHGQHSHGSSAALVPHHLVLGALLGVFALSTSSSCALVLVPQLLEKLLKPTEKPKSTKRVLVPCCGAKTAAVTLRPTMVT